MKTKWRNAVGIFALAAVLGMISGCDLMSTPKSDTIINNNPVIGGTSGIKIISSNLGSGLGQLLTHNPDDILQAKVPYLPVKKAALYNGTTPYLTFEFNADISRIFGSTLAGDADISESKYVFGVNNPAALVHKRLASLPSVAGGKVTLTLPAITDHATGTQDDGNAFALNQKYLVDFFVQVTSGEILRVSVAFIPTLDDPVLGPFGNSDLWIFGKSAEGQQKFSLYLIDQNKVFFLNKGTTANHTTDTTNDEVVWNGTTTVPATGFTTYENRFSNSLTSREAWQYDNLEYLATNNRTGSLVNLRWNLVTNATEYWIYTTSTDDGSTDWEYVDAMSAGDFTGTYGEYDFDLSSYPISTGYRAVRVVPVNALQTGTPALIRLVDEVRPVTDAQDRDNTANNFTYTGLFTDHHFGEAQAEGEIVNAAGTKSLVVFQPDTNFEGYTITQISGNLTVSTTATDGGILPLTVADATAFVTNPPVGAVFYQLGTNAVGLLNPATKTLSLLIRVDCFVGANGGTVSYTSGNTEIKGDITVTYADPSGNRMISRTDSSVSKNNGQVIFVEQ